MERSRTIGFRARMALPALALWTWLPAAPVQFTDITAEAGIRFRHFNGAAGHFYFPEIAGPGAAFLDYDRDGDQDIFLVNGSSLPAPNPATDPNSQLYRNDGSGTFTEVTPRSMIDLRGFFGMGAAAGDYDNDGDPDLYVTGYLRSVLLVNNGDGTFRDGTDAAGVRNPGHWATSAGFFDFDRDGLLDLFVCNYVRFDTAVNPPCSGGGFRSYCHPSAFEGDPNVLYRNNGDGTFSDVSGESGVAGVRGKSLGVAFADYDRDGWIDVFVANDTVADFLFHNQGNGTFREVGFLAGVAYNEDGHARAGMGVDFGDYDGDGRLDLIVTNFTSEGNALFRNAGDGSFAEVTRHTGIRKNSFLKVGFGVRFFDYDNDADLDVMAVNGHVIPRIAEYRDDTSFPQEKLLYDNREGKFRERSRESGDCFSVRDVGRGAAFADIDNDGDVDVLVTNNAGGAQLLRNDGGNRNNWLLLKLVGAKSNRDGIGARLTARIGGRVVVTQVQRAASYLSSQDRRVHLGLGASPIVDRLRIEWPSGRSQTMRALPANRILTIEETVQEGP
ncbi:MAG: CRTAC1 family protein [Acidobacteriota bacterium]|nr:CRTAC1 family protein [Acidobacteriota bacterium]